MAVYRSSGMNPSSYLNGRMLELYNEIGSKIKFDDYEGFGRILGVLASTGVSITGLVESITHKSSQILVATMILAPVSFAAINKYVGKTLPEKKIRKYVKRKLGKDFNENEFNEILNLRGHIKSQRRAQSVNYGSETVSSKKFIIRKKTPSELPSIMICGNEWYGYTIIPSHLNDRHEPGNYVFGEFTRLDDSD